MSASGRSLTYSALNAAANRVARAVLAAASPADPVAVLIGQGTSVIVALLGVLKAGKIFVPLDPRQPRARMRRILDDSGAKLVVTNDSFCAEARGLLQPGMDVVNVDALGPALASSNLGLPIAGEAPACLMYTSGSTGRPKGVIQTHRSLLERTRAYTELLQLDQRDRLILLASCSVAQGLSTTLQALLNGASLHPFDLREVGVGDLAPWLAEHGITVFVSTTSTFRHFARTLTARDECPLLRQIRLGSEPIFAQDVELYRKHFPRDCRLVGTLGSTEAGPVAAYVITHDSDVGDVAPAGHPLNGTTVRILDDRGRPRPAGEPGEIAVWSRFLFSGYWRDPARTAAAFVDRGSAGERLYRTGDLGRFRADGCLEFLGRGDSRVKIRGHRVELEEIERALCAHPFVLEAAVVDWPDRGGDKRLAAYVVPEGAAYPEVNDLFAHLRSTLPEHMVPSSFCFLQTLPRTASGKVRRAGLPARWPAPAVASVDRRRPSDRVEMHLTNLWEDLIGHGAISVTDNFFELGGDSLLAAQLAVSIERAFGVKLPLSTLIKAGTIECQAQLLRERGTRSQWPSLVGIRESGTKPPLFCVHLVEGHVLSYRDLARHLPGDQPVYGLQSRGLSGRGPINSRIEDMARDYVEEIRMCRPRGPYAICGWSFGGVVAFEVARQLERHGETVALVALFDTYAPEHPHDRRARLGLRRQVFRVPLHLRTLLRGPGRAAYLATKIRAAREVLEARVWRMLVLWLRRGGWLPRGLRNVRHANSTARREYVPRPYGGRITLFKTADSHGDGPHDPLMGWGSLANGGLEVHLVPGSHASMVFEPHVRTLAGKLARCLDNAWAESEARRHRDESVA